MGKRGDRRRLRQVEMKESKALNGPRKHAERARRRTKLLGMLQQAKAADTRVLRNFVAVELGKPEAAVTSADVTQLLSVASKGK
jgi:hypothetical protein